MKQLSSKVLNSPLLALVIVSQSIQGDESSDTSVHTCSLLQTSKSRIAVSVSRGRDSEGHVQEEEGEETGGGRRRRSSFCSRNTSSFTPVKLEKSCPDKCPFSQRLPDDHCHKVCIKSEFCGTFHPLRSFADPKSKECVATCGKLERDHVVGCAVCDGIGFCKTCHNGLYLKKDGSCADHLSSFWRIVWSVFAILGVLLALYLFDLKNRPVVNHHVLHHALQHREEGKVWVRKEKDGVWHQHKIADTAVLHTDVSGQGVLLYFSTLKFAMLMASVLVVGVFITYRFSSLAMQTEGAQENCHSAKSDVKQEDAYQGYHYRMFLGMVTIYTIVFVSSLVHVWHQTDLSNRWDETHATHEDYALRIAGLPADATDPSELKDFFTNALETVEPVRERPPGHNPRIIGVSIAYDYIEHENFIQDCLDDWVTHLEIEDGRRDWKHRPPDSELVSYDDDSRFQIPHLRFLDYFTWGSCGDDEGATEIEAANCQEVLSSLKCSGTAFIVGSTPEVVDLLFPFFKHSDSAPLFRGKYKIQMKQVYSEPNSLSWANFTTKKRWPRLLLGVLLLLGTIALWLCLYLPYALSVTHALRVPGSEPGFLEGNLLGLLIACGNAIVSQVVDIVTTWAGFPQKDRRDIAVMSLAFLATLLNTGFDIWMVLKVAQHQNTFEDTNDRIVARELMSIIVPGYLILPYIATPFVEHVLPYFLGTWLVRSRRTNIRRAEKFLECPEFDICWRYSDVLNNFTICLLMLTLVTPKSHEVMCWLLVFLLLIFGIDKYKLLRETSQTFYTTRLLEDAAQFWFSIPSGLLAGITVGWACSVHVEILPHENAALLSVLGFFAHVLLYTLLCKLIRACVKPPESETTTYHEMCEQLKKEGKVWSYFNTNPIFCLRSKYLEVVEPGVDVYPCVPFVPGKQFLQPGAPKKYKPRAGRGLFKTSKTLVSAFLPPITPSAKKDKKSEKMELNPPDPE